MSYVTAMLTRGLTALVHTAAFQALAGVAAPDRAMSHVVKTSSGGPRANAGQLGMGTAADGAALDLRRPGYAIIGTTGVTTSPGGVGWDDRDGSIEIRLVMPRLLADETPAQAADRAWDTAGDIAEQIDAQRGSATGFADAESSVDGLFQDDEGVHRDHTIAVITIAIRG